MPEIRLTVNGEFMEALKRDTGIDKAATVTDEALALYQWAVAEAKKGRVLLSTDADGKNPQRIVLPALEKAKLQG